ncbi:DUF3072 domain-containing protein [Mucilaginibacter phyllosphaerae]|uniref:DUF3072 domain-containing protein n=1 Tax=Mucilaginibacter phyllosphaerae TaxID=1812349 RepID=A0A4Y8AJ34_9SPHI|nr:DUF3072 domain-containing protein [Mucilaginibacter phyllosphaerae]MBB3967907.1 hypothetical protein [Mucilaginibacter phyllosphaerae]TEW69053.1 DUF3072 domain-containing protein [Mucilaginibacter phyllosphaerae]GGH02483.1 hypothetical protein GCM10007352_04770 [Mucilaginibacter phyllosphaerae]
MANVNNDNELFDDTNKASSADTNDGLKGSNTIKDPDEWTTGDEPMTGAQQSYLKTLSDEAGEAFDDSLTKADASKKIDELQHKTGRGLDNGLNR